MKRSSEGTFRASLGDVDLAMHVYKPSDRDINKKPCDYMTWVAWSLSIDNGPPSTLSAWFEVKDVDAVNVFNFRELRPAQVAGIRTAARLGIPYWLAVYWRRHRAWTISNAKRLVDEEINQGHQSVTRELLMSRYGVDATPATLSSVLKDVLLGDV